jgi:hypothetical protein
MASNRINSGGWLAIGLAVLGSLIALVREFMLFQQSGAVEWGHVALALGVPVLMYAIVTSRRRGNPDASGDSGDAA